MSAPTVHVDLTCPSCGAHVVTDEPVAAADDLPATYSVAEAALLTGFSQSTIYDHIKAGTLPFPTLRIGTKLRVSGAGVRAFIANGKTQAVAS